ncbi:sugar phosphate isomerase/epimerase family protein [Methanococcoides methylutens]|uniref:Endonuclease IV n=1 Tax=Methanococcoides methylutens MM1 TaxID=1434104 RepID=A0A0E3STL2_METMT|nr:sugar phosphate isomerase/epimerase family protein [Methanococcoides methylutens]AKB86032.1 endonuclease IV [Methanococcoides methylutens MM1]
MMIGASSFAGELKELDDHVQSVELYMPKLGVYEGSKLQKERLEMILDELSTCDLQTSMHAHYFADVPTYPKELVVDTASMGEMHFTLMEECIELAGRLGTKAVVMHPGRVGDDREASLKRMVSNLGRLAAFASENNVMIGLENKEATDPGNLCCEAEELLKVVDAVNSPNLGVTFDVGHANLTCEGDSERLAAFVRTISDHVVHVHLHDNYGYWTSNYDGDEHMAPGSGNIDYSVLKGLNGYKGIYNLEVFSMDDVLAGKKVIGEYVMP